MKGEAVQIHWHDKQPVFAADFDPSLDSRRLATCGGDGNIRIWRWDSEGQFQYAATLSRHTGPVNCVRFSPNGTYLASVGDGKKKLKLFF